MSIYRPHVALVYNVTGQTLEFYPPIEEIVQDGAPTAAATYRVWRGGDSNDAAVQFSGTATFDSVSTTTTVLAGPSQDRRNRVTLTSTSNIVIGRRYLLRNTVAAGGQRQVIVPRAVLSATAVDHEADIGYEFAAGSTFVGMRHSFVVDAAFIAAIANINMYTGVTSFRGALGAQDTNTIAPPYRVEWTYVTAGGFSRRHLTTFDVCRAPLKHSVSVENLKATFPDVIWQEWTQNRGEDFAEQIDEAFTRVKFDIRMAGYDPNMVTDPQIVDRLTQLAALALITAAVGNGDADRYETNYRTAFEKAIGTGLKAWMATTSTGAITTDPIQQLWLER